ncbi:MAG: ImmA/IrrE family metallo-endopeptidase [Oligoflexales bacterium]
MKQNIESKYPYSANLFRFCRRILDDKHGGVRVIDQDVGQILGFDPADCSHWKKGRKNVRSVHAVKSIANHLGIDERLIVDVATGEISENEAFHEYAGYGAYQVDPKLQEKARKDYYRNHASQWNENQEHAFREAFYPNKTKILAIVDDIHKKILFEEAPLYLPEVVTAHQRIRIQPGPEEAEQNVTSEKNGEQLNIVVRKGAEVRPFTRYQIAVEMAKAFLPDQSEERASLSDFAKHLNSVEANLFAAALLAPAHMIRKEIKNTDPTKDIITQLAEIFWVSRGFMARRVQEILSN